jgi:hypothetical protein
MVDRARTREAALVSVLLALGLGGAALLLRSMRERDPVSVPAAAPRRDVLVVAAGAGVQRSTPGGEWAAVRAGDVLAVADSIRTDGDGTAEIELGRGSHVTVAERTEITVRELTAAVHRVGLLRGRIAVDVQADGTRVMRVEDGSGSILVSASAGRMGVVAAPGSLSVFAEEGEAVIESGGEAVEVPRGHEASAWRGRKPVAPAPVPHDLLRRVVRAMEERRASVCAVVEVGAAEVLVDGEPAEVPPDGRLVLRVPPRERRRGVVLTVRHASGLVERQHLPCWDGEADVSDLEVRWKGR